MYKNIFAENLILKDSIYLQKVCDFITAKKILVLEQIKLHVRTVWNLHKVYTFLWITLYTFLSSPIYVKVKGVFACL